jgi:hypothetical protein
MGIEFRAYTGVGSVPSLALLRGNVLAYGVVSL